MQLCSYFQIRVLDLVSKNKEKCIDGHSRAELLLPQMSSAYWTRSGKVFFGGKIFVSIVQLIFLIARLTSEFVLVFARMAKTRTEKERFETSVARRTSCAKHFIVIVSTSVD